MSTSADSPHVWRQATLKIFRFTFWSDFDIEVNCWILAYISIILTTRKHATKIWEVSLAVYCQTKIVKCGYAGKGNFEVKIIVLPVDCILINKVHWWRKNSGTQNFWNFVIWRSTNDVKVMFESPIFSFAYAPKL